MSDVGRSIEALSLERAYTAERMPAVQEIPEGNGNYTYSVMIAKSEFRDAVNVMVLQRIVKRKALVTKNDITMGLDFEVLKVSVLGWNKEFRETNEEKWNEMTFVNDFMPVVQNVQTDGAFHQPVVVNKTEASKPGIDYDKVYQWYEVNKGEVFPEGISLFGAQSAYLMRAINHFHFRFKEVIPGLYEFTEGSLDTLIALITYCMKDEPYKKPDSKDLAG